MNQKHLISTLFLDIGMKGISHVDYDSTVAKLQALDLTIMTSVHG